MTSGTRHSLYAVHGENDLDYDDGWVIRTFGIGHDPTHHGGEDFRGSPHTVIARLNNGYYPNGTIPAPPFYEAFAQRCANFVEASPGCSRWIIGNEPNHAQERPNGRPILPTDYAACYNLCRAAIKGLPGHAEDEVLVAAVAPWNNQTAYPGNEAGDWLLYFEDIQRAVAGVDGFALHTYARDQTPSSVVSWDTMDEPFENHLKGFRTYLQWMDTILPQLRGLPVYITEFNAIEPWLNVNTGFVRQAYQEINTHNSLHPTTPILCLAMYRWQFDKWAFKDKPAVIEDFYEAVELGYAFPTDPVDPPEEDTLKNPSLELPYYRDAQNSTVEVAHDWVYFASSGKPPERDGPCQLPEYKALNKSEDPRRVWDGNTAQCWFIRWKIFDAGIYQVVEVAEGATYQFNVMVQAWCSNSDDPTVSDGDMHVMLGIDPTGGQNWQATEIVWSNWERAGAEYKQVFSPKVLATGDRITVFVRAWNKWELSHNDIYIDDTHLVQVSPPPVEPPPGGEFDWERFRKETAAIVRAELDRTVWVSEAR